jgi:hypothetical protein
MKPVHVLAFLLVLPALPAHADLPSDAALLADFDANFERCEASFPHMRGKGDETYAKLSHFEFNKKARTYLAGLRRSAQYRAQKQQSRPPTGEEQAGWCREVWAEAIPSAKPGGPTPMPSQLER